MGSIECGRPLDGDLFIDENEKGAHALGYNANSIGICLVGKKEFPIKQLKCAITFVSDLKNHFDIKLGNIIGHYETLRGQKKTCPNIDMDWFRREIKIQNG